MTARYRFLPILTALVLLLSAFFSPAAGVQAAAVTEVSVNGFSTASVPGTGDSSADKTSPAVSATGENAGSSAGSGGEAVSSAAAKDSSTGEKNSSAGAKDISTGEENSSAGTDGSSAGEEDSSAGTEDSSAGRNDTAAGDVQEEGTEKPARTGKSSGTTKYKGIDYRRVYNYDYYVSQPYGKKYAGKPEKAIAHFVNVGMAKQQQASAEFDPVSYRYGCPSLRLRFRSDYAKYYLHYIKTGHKYARFRRYATGVTRMRKPATKYGKVDLKAVYDYDYYVTRYPSVIETVGDDDRAVLKHFAEIGMKKGREGCDTEHFPKAAPDAPAYTKLRKKIKKTASFDGSGLIVCIDAGHQRHGDYTREAIGPGASAVKPKVTSGAYGKYSHKNEYEINLDVSLKLEKELKARGYTVVMTRSTHDVHITNMERAVIANKAKADIMIRIHANDISASSLNGVFCYAAASNNPYLSKKVIARGQRLAVLLRDAQAAATKQRKLSILYQNDMTGINWAKMPCAIVEMGFMSNPTEDLRLANGSFQKKIAKGLADGVDRYFLELKK